MIISKSYVICLLFKILGFTPGKHEQPPRRMKLNKENEKNKKDEKHIGKLIRENPKKKVSSDSRL